MQKDKDVIEIDVVEILQFMLRRWYAFLLATLSMLLAGLCICNFLITPQYKSTTKIIVLSQQNSGSLTYSDMQLASQLTKDYEELIVSRDVLESVIESCGLEDRYKDLLERVKVENITDTRIISITVEDPSPIIAQKIANSIRDTAAEHIKNVTDVEAVNMTEAANLPSEPSSPSIPLWSALSAGLGFLLVFIIQLVRFLSDDTIKSTGDVEKYLGLPTLALIPKGDLGNGRNAGRKKARKTSKKGSPARNAHTEPRRR